MIRGIIWDMDGVLIDSEPYWRQAEIEVFARVGVLLTDEDCLKTLGFRIDEVTKYWHNIQPWDGPSTQEVAEWIVDRVIELVQEHGKAMPGAIEAVRSCVEGGYRLAVASSSHMRLINVVLEKLQIRDLFRVVCSAEREAFGKPHPAVFLTTAEKLGLEPTECLVIEDSPSGIIAGKAAKMRVIAVPEPHNADKPEMQIAFKTLTSLVEFDVTELAGDTGN